MNDNEIYEDNYYMNDNHDDRNVYDDSCDDGNGDDRIYSILQHECQRGVTRATRVRHEQHE